MEFEGIEQLANLGADHAVVHDDGTALKSMEIQANYLASCLLMPRERFRKAFYEQLQIRGVQNKGFGPLFVDTQKCNLSSTTTA